MQKNETLFGRGWIKKIERFLRGAFKNPQIYSGPKGPGPHQSEDNVIGWDRVVEAINPLLKVPLPSLRLY